MGYRDQEFVKEYLRKEHLRRQAVKQARDAAREKFKKMFTIRNCSIPVSMIMAGVFTFYYFTFGFDEAAASLGVVSAVVGVVWMIGKTFPA